MKKNYIENKFLSHGIKNSKNRVKIFAKILELEESFDALSLYDNLRDQLDRATVYRNLNYFKEKKLIREAIIVDGKKFYELNTKDLHPHFVCTSCKEVQCLEDVSLNLGSLEKSKKIQTISINITGVCERCNK